MDNEMGNIVQYITVAHSSNTGDLITTSDAGLCDLRVNQLVVISSYASNDLYQLCVTNYYVNFL